MESRIQISGRCRNGCTADCTYWFPMNKGPPWRGQSWSMTSGLPKNSEAEVTVTIPCILDDKLDNTFDRLEKDTKLRGWKKQKSHYIVTCLPLKT